MASIAFGNQDRGFQIGVHNGPIHIAEQPETPPSPLSTVPFRRDLDFVDRGTLLHQIGEKGALPESRIALVGLGGVGKSQLAIEYSYRVRDRSPETWVFWIHASNAARFEQSCRDIAERVKIPGRKDPKANIFKLIYDWLIDERQGKWVLILDNLDDSQFLHEVPLSSQDGLRSGQNSATLERPLLAYLPLSSDGSIIITTRSRDAVSKIVEESDMIPIEPMDVTDATLLFEKKLGEHAKEDQANKGDIIQLTTALEFMPLAIAQAAAYIKQRAPRMSVSQYLKEFQKSNRKKIGLLDHEGGRLRRDWEAENSILITLQMSFDHIRQTRPTAANLISLMSFFDRQGIPEYLLRSRTERGDGDRNPTADDEDDLSDDYLPNDAPSDDVPSDDVPSDDVPSDDVPSDDALSDDALSYDDDGQNSATESSVDDEFESDILILRNYSLISITSDKKTFEMHRLVQLAMLKWLGTRGQLEQWKQQFIEILSSRFPTDIYKNWGVCNLLFSHVQSAVTQRPDNEGSLQKWAELLNNASSYAFAMENIIETQRMAVMAMKARKRILGLDNLQTVDSIEMVALSYELRGQWRKAEELHMQVTETRKRALGSEHPNTLDSMVNLATTYRRQGRWKEAEELGVLVMETSKRVLGLEHSITLGGMSDLAATYWIQGRLNEAEELAMRVVDARRRVLGRDHPITLESMSVLAGAYMTQERLNDAEELEMQLMDTRRRALGPEHPKTLTSIGDLATIYWMQGRSNEAEELGVQVVDTRRQILGPEHPDTLTSINNLAIIYRTHGRLNEAEELGVQVIDTRRRVLGPEHPKTLSSISSLAATYWNQERWKEAEELEVQVMDARRQALGLDHPITLDSMGNLAVKYGTQERWNDAEELGVQVMDTHRRVLGPEHPKTLDSMAKLALVYWNQERWSNAEELEEQLMDTRRRVLGSEHPKTLTSMHNLACSWDASGKDQDALLLMTECVRLRNQRLGPDHPDTIDSTSILAEMHEENRSSAVQSTEIQDEPGTEENAPELPTGTPQLCTELVIRTENVP